MNLQQIYQPVTKELFQVEIELKEQINSVSRNQKFVNEIICHFFNNPGKRLRPALVLLSAKAISSTHPITQLPNQMVLLATAVELIHAASLIHDDIVDDTRERRGQPSLNKHFGNQIAVLSGDMLYVRAFSLLTEKFDKEILKILSGCIEKMCCGEINELKRDVSSFEEYLKIIEDKTASFMSVCCQCGAMSVTQGTAGLDPQILSLQKYGLNFGISYQLMDDFSDGDSVLNPEIDMHEKAKEYSNRAKESIALFKNSKYIESLVNLSEYVLKQKHERTKTLSGINI